MSELIIRQESAKDTNVLTKDFISRADATSIPVLPKEYREYQTFNLDDAYEQGWYDLQKCIETLPSADRPTGEWVRLEREENVYDLHGVPTWGVNYMCDKCGFITTAIQDHFGQYRWCPSCGEKKRGGSHEHDKRTSQEVTETGEPVETQ